LFLPPGPFIAAPMEIAMMKATDGYGEAVADLAAHCLLFGKFDVMRV
jgi:hypothetical protein